MKPSIISFCNKSILEGALSTEVLLTEVKNNIVSECYDILLKDLPESDKDNIPDYDSILHQLHLKTISYSTMSRWMKYLGFKYCENQKCYYTDGHERDEAVRYRIDRFLIQYFEAELLAYKWVQVDEDTAKELERDELFPRNCS